MWVSLHQHSQFSILDASCSVEQIAKRAAEFQMPAVALTDHGNMHGAVEFYLACETQGIKPIIGCEMYVAPGSRREKKKDEFGKVAYHLILLAKNSQGYHNLCCLTSKGFLEGFYYHPRIDQELLREHREGLICLSGCLSSKLAQLAQRDEAECVRQIREFQALFGEDFYLELQRHEMNEGSVQGLTEPWLKQFYEEMISRQKKVNEKYISLSKELGIPLVATNDVHYLEASDWQAHEILLNIQSGEPVELWEMDSLGNRRFQIPNPKRRVYPSRECYFKSSTQMLELFADIPDAVSNSVKIAEKCHLSLDFKTKHYPIFIPPALKGKSYTPEERKEASEIFLRKLCLEGIEKRYTPQLLEKVAKVCKSDPEKVVSNRLEEELAIITSKGMCDYLLIVWDLIYWAKKQGIPVGPGRGSGAGAITLFLIGITDIEPLTLSLFFERFINPERVSYPDIDVDICMVRRAELIDYAVQKYGNDCVAQIITFGTMKAKMTIKDVGRVLSIPLAKVNAIAKLVPEDLNMTLERALEIDVDLHTMYTQDEDAKRIIDFGKRLEGSIRNTSTHAAGIIISSEPLTNHIPICTAKDSEMVATQYSMNPVESVGMLKMDLLGLKTLTSITRCVEQIALAEQKKIHWTDLPLDDRKTFALLQEGKTLGVFQMESGGMQELAKQLAPDRFEEIIAIGALYRPGPMEMIPSYIARKHKQEPIEYDHPWMESILAETYGIMVYQEQVMQIASRLANYSLGEGDVLRKAMGKKQPEQMANEREKFKKGAAVNGIEEQLATKIFDKVEKFAAYGFNKSHAACYGYLTYVTAFLKANYPSQWLAALMSCDQDDLSKISKLIHEAKSMQIAILPPDINTAGKLFTTQKEGIRFALTAVKGVGEQVVDTIIAEREKGFFTSFYTFFQRIDLRKVGKKVIESLVAAGCFDFTNWTRAQMISSIEAMYDAALKEQKEKKAGILSLFSYLEKKEPFEQAPVVIEPEKNHILSLEKELLGFYLTGHPMDGCSQLMKKLSCIELSKIFQTEENALFRTAFIIDKVQVKISTKNQKKFAILRISDQHESFELPIWPDLYEQKHMVLLDNQLIFAVLQVDRQGEGVRIDCRWLDDFTKANEKMVEEADAAYDRAKMMQGKQKFVAKPKKQESILLEIAVDLEECRLTYLLQIKQLLTEFGGKNSVELHFYSSDKLAAKLFINDGIDITTELLHQLKGMSFVRSTKSVPQF